MEAEGRIRGRLRVLGCIPALLAVLLTGCAAPVPGDTWPGYRRPQAAPGTDSVSVQWFGVSTLYIADGASSVMIDGFLSRPSVPKLMFARAKTDEGAIRELIRQGRLPARADAVVVAHHHYDHAMDAAWLANEYKAVLLAPPDTQAMASADGHPAERFEPLSHGWKRTIGSFDIEVIETPHAPDFWLASLLETVQGWHGANYRIGPNYSIVLRHRLGTIAIVPSAGGRRNMLGETKADVVFLGIGRLGKQSEQAIDAYWDETVARPEAKLAIPIHWDNFTRPLDKPLRPPPLFDDLGTAIERLELLRSKASGKRIEVLQPFVTVPLLPLAQ